MTETQPPGSTIQQDVNQTVLTTQEDAFMMDGGQSRKEASNQTISCLLKPKTSLSIGTWNVRTLYQTGKLAQAIAEMDRYGVDILALSEVRWTGQGRRNLSSGHTIIYSGRNDDQHLNGVGVLLSKTAKSTLIDWVPMGERLMKLRFNSKYAKMTLIPCYAPQEDKSQEEKDEFYDKLNNIIKETPRHDVLVVLGDMNAKVGRDNSHSDTVGKKGFNLETNDNGERLIELCEENDMIVGGTFFQHKDIHKYTWTSPDGKNRNQIDHVIINNKWKSSLTDVRTRRGADINSDHELVIAKIHLKLRKAKKGATRGSKFNTKKLNDARVAREFRYEIFNRFSVLQDEQELTIDKFNQELINVSEKILGPSRRKKEQWISEDSWRLIEERRKVKERLLKTKSPRLVANIKEEYKKMDKNVKKATKLDKKNYFENLAEIAEKAAQKQDMKTLYQTSKLLTNKFKNNDVPIKDRNGHIIPNEALQMQRWKDHFESILNREAPRLRANIKPSTTDLDINTDPPNLEEITKAINGLKEGKAGGNDMITAEMIKVESEMTPKILHKIFLTIWNTEEIPKEWTEGLIVKLPKKGDLTDCGNWRGIMLLSITSKIFSRILLNRMNPSVDTKLRKQQAGFRKGCSCTDHIFTLRQIFEQSIEWNASIYANFIDFEKAFDSVHRPALWSIMRHYGIPQKLVDLTKMMYTDFQAKVICGNNLSEGFKLNTGVKQGCILSPFLFSMTIDWLMKETTEKKKTGILWTFTETLEDLDFADDIVLLAQNHNHIQQKTDSVSSNAQKIGLKINTCKTKSMRINSKTNQTLRIGNEDIEEVDSFTYLGSKISKDGNSDNEVKERLTKARKAFGALRNIWKSNKITEKTKIRFFKSNVLSVLLYGAESWKLTKSTCHKLDTFQNRCLRYILKIFWPNIISNKDLYEKTSAEPISQIVKRRRWKWTGHVLRMDQAAIPRVALRWTPQGIRKRGRPAETWRRGMEREMKGNGWTWDQAARQAANRDRWRSYVSALCAPQHEEDK